MGKVTYYPSPKRLEKLSKSEILDLTFDLINAFNSVKTPYEIALLMQDLLTVNEVKNLAKRLRIAKLLMADETQRDISKKIHCSLATITKVNLWLNEGGRGLKKAVSTLPPRYKFPKNLPRGSIGFHLPRTLSAVAQYGLAKHQSKKIKSLNQLVSNLENKKILDKSLQESFNKEFKDIATNKKRKEFKSKL